MVGNTWIWTAMALLATSSTLATMPGSPVQSTNEQTPLPLLYDWVPDGTLMLEIRALHANKYTIVYQDILPKKGASGLVDKSLVLAFLRNKIPRNFKGWGMLDFEGVILNRLRKGPGNPEYEETTESLRQTLLAVKREWPGSKWAFWGLPSVRFWINDSGENPVTWASASTQQKEREFARQSAAFQGLLEHVDWLSPWIYDIYSTQDITNPADRTSMIASQKEWAQAKVALCKRMLASRKNGLIPVIPMFCPVFAPNGNVEEPRFVPIQEFVEEVLQPTMESGVDGLSTWNGMSYRVLNAFRDTENQHQVDLREESRDRLKKLLFPNKPFDWNAPAAKTAVNNRIRSPLLQQLQAMRKALDTLETQNEAATPESPPSSSEQVHSTSSPPTQDP